MILNWEYCLLLLILTKIFKNGTTEASYFKMFGVILKDKAKD